MIRVSSVSSWASKESKTYRMYDPVSKQVIINRDVVFEEDKMWNWNKTVEGASCVVLEWGDENELQEYAKEGVHEEEE